MTALESSAKPERPARPEPAWTLLRDLAFRRYWTGQAISLVGDQITLLAVPLLAVLMLDATPAQMGYLTAAGLAPSLLLLALRRGLGRPPGQPPAGDGVGRHRPGTADRHRARRVRHWTR